jgi:hypothetical protein
MTLDRFLSKEKSSGGKSMNHNSQIGNSRWKKRNSSSSEQ